MSNKRWSHFEKKVWTDLTTRLTCKFRRRMQRFNRRPKVPSKAAFESSHQPSQERGQDCHWSRGSYGETDCKGESLNSTGTGRYNMPMAATNGAWRTRGIKKVGQLRLMIHQEPEPQRRKKRRDTKKDSRDVAKTKEGIAVLLHPAMTRSRDQTESLAMARQQGMAGRTGNDDDVGQ